MNRTSNYNLCQFEETDRVRRTDFNEDNAKIDAALAGKADGTEVPRLEEAIASAAAKAEEEHIYFGTFVGDGEGNRIFQLPWTPKFLIFIGKVNDNPTITYLFQKGYCYHERSVVIDGGDQYRPLLNGSKVTFQNCRWYNDSGETTRYILFR